MAISPQENVAIMVNEEDHLRIQYMLSGFRLPEVWDEINRWTTSSRRTSRSPTAHPWAT